MIVSMEDKQDPLDNTTVFSVTRVPNGTLSFLVVGTDALTCPHTSPPKKRQGCHKNDHAALTSNKAHTGTHCVGTAWRVSNDQNGGYHGWVLVLVFVVEP